MVDLRVNLCGLELDNPVVPASGTFGFGKEFSEFYDINMLGSFSFKGTTRDARFGNPTPRIAECTAGMINAVGLQNPGVHHVTQHELPELKKNLSQAGDRQRERLLRGGLCLYLPAAGQRGAGWDFGSECILPQCARRRYELWHRSGLCRRSDPGGKGSDHQAGVH